VQNSWSRANQRPPNTTAVLRAAGTDGAEHAPRPPHLGCKRRLQNHMADAGRTACCNGAASHGNGTHASHLHSSDEGTPILGNMKCCCFPAAILGVHVGALLEQRLYNIRVVIL
jgi:hypothetical protein